jgi:hypothetical protein
VRFACRQQGAFAFEQIVGKKVGTVHVPTTGTGRLVPRTRGQEFVPECSTPIGRYPASDSELDGILIAQGHRIKPGVLLPRVANLDVAPTISQILGQQIPNAEGRMLTEVLKPE